jgi:hypothetical protein
VVSLARICFLPAKALCCHWSRCTNCLGSRSTRERTNMDKLDLRTFSDIDVSLLMTGHLFGVYMVVNRNITAYTVVFPKEGQMRVAREASRSNKFAILWADDQISRVFFDLDWYLRKLALLGLSFGILRYYMINHVYAALRLFAEL